MAREKREKETRKELLEEPDPVTVYLHRIAAFFFEYRKPIITGVVALLVVIAGTSGYFYYRSQQESAASVLFAGAMDRYAEAVAENGSPGEFEAVKNEFSRILEEYGNTEVARLATVQYASAALRAGETDEAIRYYERAVSRLPSRHRFRETAVMGLAYAYEEKGDYDSAIRYFEMIADNPAAASRDQALFRLGGLYAEAGNPEKSREAYLTIVEDYPDSMYYELARTTTDR